MTIALTAGRATDGPAPPLPTWALYAGLAAMTAVAFQLGTMGIAATRALFVVGCVAAGIVAWRSSPAQHLETAIVLFAVAPFLRRVVDGGAGYEPTGYMLTGPVLAILVPVVELRALLTRPGARGAWALHAGAAPYLIYGACVGYGATLSLIQGDMMNAASGLLKWGAPVLYGLWLLHRAEGDPSFLRGAARAFAIVTPIMGVYGVMQYVSPPEWDRAWMVFAQMTSIGLPEPYQVRVFSTMNSPASFATYTACGLLLFGFTRSGWQSMLLALPSSLGLLLSMYRTAWLALAAGLLVCLVFSCTRGRALLVVVVLTGAVAVAAVATPFGDAISERLGTLTTPSQDGSGQERLGEYVALFDAGAATLVGGGYSNADAGTPGQMPADGQIIAAWLAMGLVVGLVSIACIVWVGGQALQQVWRRADATRVTLGAVVAGALVQIPLATMATAEIGVLFWVFAAIASTGGEPDGAAA